MEPCFNRIKRKRDASDADRPIKLLGADFHATNVTPVDFLSAAVENPYQFLRMPSADANTDIDSSGTEGAACAPTCPAASKGESLRRFGLSGEAMWRDCYSDLLREVYALEIEDYEKRKEIDIENKSFLIEIRGSAGIGKSAFLGILMARHKVQGMKNFALIYSRGAIDAWPTGGSDLLFSVWLDGKLRIDNVSTFSAIAMQEFTTYLEDLEYIFMDGCAVFPASFATFIGTYFVAASPSVSTHLVKKGISHRCKTLYMPPWSLEEARAAADLLSVPRDVVNNNYAHMNGIVRYLFEKGMAQERVKSAVQIVSAQVLMQLVTSNQSSKEIENIMVHSLVLWKLQLKEDGTLNYREDVSYELVSRYAERLVAAKLVECDLADLTSARRALSKISGTESYAGALFEAYAVKTIHRGGPFKLESLESTEDPKTMVIQIPKISGSPVILDCNMLTESRVPLKSVHVADKDGISYEPKLLWPATNNFPTFDCFYFHTDGEVFSLQMTVAQTHDLKNTGANQVVKYLSKISTCKEPFKVVFVCPRENDRLMKQNFSGPLREGSKIILEEKEATGKMNNAFQQWILRL
jgi:hypothetical protein